VCLNVRKSAINCRYSAVQIMPHRNSFRRRFAMQIDKYFIGSFFFCYVLVNPEWIVTCFLKLSTLSVYALQFFIVILNFFISITWNYVRIVHWTNNFLILLK